MKAAILLLCIASCVHHVGDVCYQGDNFCQDKGTALTCEGGKLVSRACGGLKGCSKASDRSILCDQSANATAGTSCSSEYAGKGQCRLDGSGYLQCVQGTWTFTACLGAAICHDDGGVSCR